MPSSHRIGAALGDVTMSDDTRTEWICTTLDVPGGERVVASPTKPVPMGLAAKKSLWKPDTVLKVKFLQGTPALHDRVMAAAREWFIDGVRLTVVKANPGERAQVRITFDPAEGSWSYVGTDILSIHPSQPTMNLGWATLQTPKRDFWSVVIHEWGHTLGLLHEHNHPEALIRWNKDAVYADLEGPPNEWDRATIDDNVFAKYAASTVITTDFDKVSVMIYTIPSAWTLDKNGFMPSWKLSDGDTATIRKLYA